MHFYATASVPVAPRSVSYDPDSDTTSRTRPHTIYCHGDLYPADARDLKVSLVTSQAGKHWTAMQSVPHRVLVRCVAVAPESPPRTRSRSSQPEAHAQWNWPKKFFMPTQRLVARTGHTPNPA